MELFLQEAPQLMLQADVHNSTHMCECCTLRDLNGPHQARFNLENGCHH